MKFVFRAIWVISFFIFVVISVLFAILFGLFTIIKSKDKYWKQKIQLYFGWINGKCGWNFDNEHL